MKFFVVFFQAVKAKYIQWIVYCAIGLGFLLLYLSLFPSIQSQTASYSEIFRTLPKGLIIALNITNSQPTLLGYLSSKHFGLVWLLLIILFATAYGSFVIAKEVENKTIGFLLSQPISRSTLYLGRLTAGIAGLAIFILTTELITWPLALFMHYGINYWQVISIGVGGFLFGLSVLCLAIMFSAFLNSSGKVSAGTAGVMLISYTLFIMASLSPNLDNLKYFSLFHYFAPGDIITTGNIAWQSIVAFIGSSVVTAVVGLIRFRAREIQL